MLEYRAQWDRLLLLPCSTNSSPPYGKWAGNTTEQTCFQVMPLACTSPCTPPHSSYFLSFPLNTRNLPQLFLQLPCWPCLFPHQVSLLSTISCFLNFADNYIILKCFKDLVKNPSVFSSLTLFTKSANIYLVCAFTQIIECHWYFRRLSSVFSQWANQTKLKIQNQVRI